MQSHARQARTAKERTPTEPHRPGRELPAGLTEAEWMLRLQRTIGNDAVRRYLAAGLHPFRLDDAGPAHPEDETAEAEAEAAAERIAEDGGAGITGDVPPGSGNPAGDARPDLARDLPSVRVHTGGDADSIAAAIGARAFTIGDDIVLRAGEDSLATLAHEYTHVAQQRRGRPRLRRQVKQRSPATKKEPTGHQFYFRVTVSRQMSEDELLLEFVRQFHRLQTIEEAQQYLATCRWRWAAEGRPATAADAEQGYVNLRVTLPLARTPRKLAETEQLVSAMSAEQKASLNERTDAAFYEATGTPPRTKLGTSDVDKEQAAYWLQLRSQIVDLDALDPQIKAFLFDPAAKRRVHPRDYAKALRLAKKAQEMTAAERADYKSKVNAETADWDEFERSIDRYNIGAHVRGEQAGKRAEIKTRLTGHLGLYQRVRAFRKLEAEASAGLRTDREGFTYGDRSDEVAAERESLTAVLQAHHYAGIEAFEAMCKAYEQAFVTESVAIAEDMLARYEHLLWEQERRYRDPAVARGIQQRVQATGAAGRYREASELRSTANMIVSRDLGPQIQADVQFKMRLRAQAGAAEAAAEEAVRAATPQEPLIAEKDFDREALASAGPDEVAPMLAQYIADRRSDIAKCRYHLSRKPEQIYRLDILYRTSLALQGLEPGSIYYEIVEDRRKEIKRDETIMKVLLAVFAIAAGLLTMGSGTVAVLGASAAVALSAYGMLQEFAEYDQESAAYGAKLLSDKPWMGWCVIVVLGLGLDAAGLGTALRALGELAPAVKALDATGDLVKFEEEMARIAGLQREVKEALRRGGELETEAKAAWRAILRPPQYLRAVIIPGLEEFGRLVWAVYLSIRKGITDLSVFLKQQQIDEWYDALAPELKAAVQEGYIAAGKATEDILEHGKSLGMTDDQTKAFLKYWGTEEVGLEQTVVRERMTAWAEQHRQAQALATDTGTVMDTPFGFRDPEHWQSFRATARKELDRALKKVDRNAEAYLQGSSVTGISYEKQIPFRPASDFDVAVASEALWNRARKMDRKRLKELGLEVQQSPVRLALKTPEQFKEFGLADLVRKLHSNLEEAGAAFDRPIRLVIFQDLEAARKPIGEASKETVRQTIPLAD